MVRDSAIENRIDSVKELAKSTLPSTTGLPMFIEQFYGNADADELCERDTQSLFEAARASWDLLHTSNGREPAIRAYNPDTHSDKWESNFTVIDLVLQDMPFLVDSIGMELQRQGLSIHFLVHPLFLSERQKSGAIIRLESPKKGIQDPALKRESVIHIQIDRISDDSQRESIAAALRSVLSDIERAVCDWQEMRAKILSVKAEAATAGAEIDAREREEALAFLQWIHDDHLTILGYREYELRETNNSIELHALNGTGLGILRCEDNESLSHSFAALPEEIRLTAKQKDLLILNKSNSRATVHRPGYLDYIGVKKYDAFGNVVGEHRFFGLYTTTAFNSPPQNIPYLRLKIEHLLERSDLPAGSHRAKLLIDIVDFYPRDELFQIGDDDLFRIATGILHLQERQRVRLFVREDAYQRFVTCLVYVPRERFSTDVRLRILEELKVVFHGQDEPQFNVQIGDSLLARIFAVIRVSDFRFDNPDIKELENRLTLLTWHWKDHLRSALFNAFNEQTTLRLFELYADAFPAGYQESHDAEAGVRDINALESLSESEPLALRLFQRDTDKDSPGHFRIKLYNAQAPIVLSDALPVLENMSLRVINARPHHIIKSNGQQAWLLEFHVSTNCSSCVQLETLSPLVTDTFKASWFNRIENDPFNALAIKAGLTSRQIVILRMYSHYLKQTGLPYSQHYIAETLQDQAEITAHIVALFEARFDPSQHNTERCSQLDNMIQDALNTVSSLDQDRILRNLTNLIQSTLRTNYYQANKNYISFKLDTRSIQELPEPRPLFEIFVYSPDIEGVHLRGGKVARGGLRWSDRKEDFRTEVLGLVKAQMVKNAVIVPEGSKGGFIVKQSLVGLERAEVMEKVIASYKTFIRGLLDLTDNLVDNVVQPPPDLIRYDEDDPYLVVAADKGTATFSDIANGVSQEYGFWLDDAFASGGSNGYDHKKMGITAKGAWESVKRHFRELGKDIQSEPFTVLGIGDMSGDVFGNGMLLSRKIKLIAAFDHRHIFIDPDPDPEHSFIERERLFALAGSSWDDYNRDVMSTGGGIYPRTLKSIEVSESAAQALGLTKTRYAPLDLIRALLQAPVELIWNGGIGTYVKASSESHSDVGDRHNDSIRVSANELRAQVIGEGGNLGMTQRSRVEFSKLGGLCNTDSIDNSAGVDCSDHEVNIKILLNAGIQSGELTEASRNQLLEEMTDEVSGLVLRHNYMQTQAISLMTEQRQALFSEHVQYMRNLERQGLLKPALEFLPDEEELSQRQVDGTSMTRPELSILLAYAKIDVYKQLVRSELVDEEYFVAGTSRYFPKPLRDRFAQQIREHRLQREIIATKITNNMLNRVGATFVFRLQELTSAPADRIVRAFSIIRDSYCLPELWQQLDSLDNQIPATTQLKQHARVNRLAEQGSLWILRTYRQFESLHAIIENFRSRIESLASHAVDLAPPSHRTHWETHTAELVEDGIPQELARSIAALDIYYLFLDIMLLADDTEKSQEDCAKTYFLTLEALDTHWLHQQMRNFKATDNWHAVARSSLEEELYALERKITRAIIRSAEETKFDPATLINTWQENICDQLSRSKNKLNELQSTENTSLATFMVAIEQLRAVLHASSMQ